MKGEEGRIISLDEFLIFGSEWLKFGFEWGK